MFADIALFTVALIWGGGFIVMKDTLDDLTPYYMNAVRFSLSFIVLATLFWKRVKKATKQDVINGSIVGIFLCTAFVTQTIGLQYTTASKSAFITGANVVMVPFLVWMISKKHPGYHAMIGAFFTIIGIGLLTLQDGFSIGLGDSLTLVCAVLFAAHIYSVGHFAENMDPYVLATIQIGVTAILSIIGALIYEPMPQLSIEVVPQITYMVLIATTAALLIQNIAQKHTPSTHAAIILSLESVFGSIFGVLLLGDVFTKYMIVGCAFIFIAIIITETKLSFLSSKKKNLKDEG